ncbi:hypothetical protein JVU11DRAFT_6853 [Chiua virens]|nr:hypothetical protein JVU11DRAFT_6853 [Chiua virens]
MTWTKLPFNLKKMFRSEIVTSFPELNYCEDAWKLDKYAKSVFNSFKQTWITNKSKDKTTSSGKRDMKSKDPESTDADTIPQPPAKRPKLDSITLPVSPTESSSSSVVPVSPTGSLSSGVDTTNAIHGLTDVSSATSSIPGPLVSTSLDLETDVIGVNNPQDSDDFELLSPLSTLPVAACLDTTASTTTRTDKFTINVPVNNLLASMSHTQLPVLSPPVQSVSAPVTGGLSQVEDTNAPATGPIPANTSKKDASATSSWRPPSAKNGRNLCAHRWLKQVKGTREEFNTFYSSLSAVH